MKKKNKQMNGGLVTVALASPLETIFSKVAAGKE